MEFQNEAVAKIVADTMNNYLMFHKLLKCKFDKFMCNLFLLPTSL